jgi:hypothetical protein
MTVYFIQAGSKSGPVKIGCSSNPERRLMTLQASHFEILRLIRTVPGSNQEEIAFHHHFKAYRIRKEWFRWHPDMLTLPVPPPLPPEPPKKREDRSVRGPKGKLRDNPKYLPGIASYLDAHGIDIREFARQIGLTYEGTRQIIMGKRAPRIETMHKIVKATNGRLEANDFFDV